MKYSSGFGAVPGALGCHRHYHSATRLNERIKVMIWASWPWFMLACCPGIWTVALWRPTSIILMSSSYRCWLRCPRCHCRVHTKYIPLLQPLIFFPFHTFIFNEPGLLHTPPRQSKSDTHTAGSQVVLKHCTLHRLKMEKIGQKENCALGTMYFSITWTMLCSSRRQSSCVAAETGYTNACFKSQPFKIYT